MFTANTARLSDGIDIFFTDSGPPPSSSDYTTLVVIHGTGFNGHGFEALHGLAHQSNLRTVIINRREYPGSTRFSAEELEAMSKDTEVILDDLASCLAQFLVAFIESNTIPQLTSDRRGGIAILGWSRGCSMLVAMLSDPSRLPVGAYAKLEAYIKNIILYDASVIFGLGPTQEPAQVYLPWTDASLTTASEKMETFKAWVSSYYDSPPPNWDGRPEHLVSSGSKRSQSTTIDNWTEEDLKRLYNPDAAAIADPPIRDSSVMRSATHNCLYNKELARNFFPHLQVIYISCRRSMWLCVWAAFEAQHLYEDSRKEGRPMKFIMMQEANHFLHSDDPVEFLAVITKEIASP